MSARGSKRDVTRSLVLLAQIRASTDELQHLLLDMDARTGKRDPSKRKGFRAKASDPKRSPAKKTVAKAKKAARRVRT